VSGFSVAPSVASLFQHGRLSNHFLENYLHKSPGGRRILTKAGFLRAQKAFLCSEDFSQAAFQQEDSTYELSWKFNVPADLHGDVKRFIVSQLRNACHSEKYGRTASLWFESMERGDLEDCPLFSLNIRDSSSSPDFSKTELDRLPKAWRDTESEHDVNIAEGDFAPVFELELMARSQTMTSSEIQLLVDLARRLKEATRAFGAVKDV